MLYKEKNSIHENTEIYHLIQYYYGNRCISCTKVLIFNLNIDNNNIIYKDSFSCSQPFTKGKKPVFNIFRNGGGGVGWHWYNLSRPVHCKKKKSSPNQSAISYYDDSLFLTLALFQFQYIKQRHFGRYVAHLQVFILPLEIEKFTGLTHYLLLQTIIIFYFKRSSMQLISFVPEQLWVFFKNANEMLIAFPLARCYRSKAIFRSAYFYLTRFSMFFSLVGFFFLYMH